MNTIWQAIERFLRTSPWVEALLKRLGIDTVHYWLLVDLFGTLSDRRELPGHLGQHDISLGKSSWLFYIVSGIMAMLFVAAGMSPVTYILIFLAFSGFLLFTTLLAEANNSLMNPVEGLVLAHQPINGATYTSAKLTHILRILLHYVPALNLIPAFAGVMLGTPWYYPLSHLASAFAEGVVLALLVCALFGWLMRFVAPARLKAVGFAAEMSSWVFYLFFQIVPRAHLKFRLPHLLPSGLWPRVGLAGIGVAVSVVIVWFGLASLSGDYLARVAAIAHGRSGKKVKVRRSIVGKLVSRLFGGPSALAGFDYLSRMMRRDWYFRRQMIGLIPMGAMVVAGVTEGSHVSPFSGKFTVAHFLPHALGLGFFMICSTISFGNDYKGAWIFLLAPSGAFRGVARGVYARLLSLLLAPHIILLPVLAWRWGVRDACLFVTYSVPASAVYLATELRLIEGIPFSQTPKTTGNPFMMMTLLAGGLVMAIAVALQWLLVFRSATVVVVATAALGVTAVALTRLSLEAFEVDIRFRLGLLSNESKGIYTEVEG